MDSVILKKEDILDFERSELDCQLLSFDVHCNSTSKQKLGAVAALGIQKCGEIFIGTDDLFNFLCTFCESSFDEVERFFVHVKGIHTQNRRLGFEENVKDAAFKSDRDLDPSNRTMTVDEIKIEIPQNTEETIDPLLTLQAQSNAELFKSEYYEDSSQNERSDENILFASNSETKLTNDSTKKSVQKQNAEEIDKRKCQYCDRILSDNQGRKEHERTHTGEKPYKCNLCDKSYTTSSQLSYHNIRHSKSRQHKCETCNRNFYTSHQLKLHTVTHTGEKPYTCTYCGAKFGHPSSLRKHDKIHSQTTKLKSSKTEDRSAVARNNTNLISTRKNPLSAESFQKNESMKSVSSVCDEEKQALKLKCVNCGMEFASKQSLRCHQKSPIRCVKSAIKKEISARKESLLKGLNAKKLDKLKCRYCDGIFSSYCRRILHERVKHTGEQPFQCHICTKSFACMYLLNSHAKYSNCKDSKKMRQSSNGMLTMTKINLNDTENSYLDENSDEIHRPPSEEYEENHNGNASVLSSGINKEPSMLGETIKCDACCREFETKDQLICHKKYVKQCKPKDEFPYKCEICKKLFTDYSNLKTHKARTSCSLIQTLLEDETDDNKETNESCSTLLESKTITVSDCMGEKTKCKMCFDEFNSKEDLLHHLINSADCIKEAVEKQKKVKEADGRKCRYCDRVMSSATRRKEHERIHTGEKPYQCRFCGKLFRLWSYVSVHEKIHTRRQK